MQLPDRPAFQLLLGEPGHLLGHVVDAQDRPSLITDLKDRRRGVIQRLAMALLLIAQGLFAGLDKEVGDVQEPFVELLIEQGQQLDQLLPVLGVGLAQAFDNEEPDLHLSSEEAGGRPVSDEAVARVLVKVDVGVDVVRIFNMAGPAEQRIVHILGGFPDALGQQGKHWRDQGHPLLDDLGGAFAHESRQLSPQRAFLARETQ